MQTRLYRTWLFRACVSTHILSCFLWSRLFLFRALSLCLAFLVSLGCFFSRISLSHLPASSVSLCLSIRVSPSSLYFSPSFLLLSITIAALLVVSTSWPRGLPLNMRPLCLLPLLLPLITVSSSASSSFSSFSSSPLDFASLSSSAHAPGAVAASTPSLTRSQPDDTKVGRQSIVHIR